MFDEWFRRSARHAEAMCTARTLVWERDDLVVAYYSLAGHVLERAALPHSVG